MYSQIAFTGFEDYYYNIQTNSLYMIKETVRFIGTHSNRLASIHIDKYILFTEHIFKYIMYTPS